MRRSVTDLQNVKPQDMSPWELARYERHLRRAQDPKVIARDQARRNRLIALEES